MPTFILFNRLPTEIRLMIWEAALPGPRVISIEERQVKSTSDPPSPSSCDLGLWSPTRAPSTLFACRESYQVASKFFVPSFAFEGSIPEIYFDFRVDTLYLRFDTFVFDDADWDDFDYFICGLERIYDTDHALKVRNLAVFLNHEDIGSCTYQLASILGFFGNIQKLTVVGGHFNRESDDEGDIIFIEAIDVIKTCRNYEAFSPKPPPLHELLETPLAVDLVSTDQLEEFLEDRREMEHDLRQELIEDGVEPGETGDIPMPHIEYKSVVTRGLKSYLDRLREEHQQKVEEKNNAKLLDGNENEAG